MAPDCIPTSFWSWRTGCKECGGERWQDTQVLVGIINFQGNVPQWCVLTPTLSNWEYRVIHKSLRDFRPLRYSSRDGHAEGEHVNRGRDTPSYCPTLQVLDMLTSEGSWQTFLAHARQSRPMAPAGLFVSQRTGSHSAGIPCTTHELFCPYVVLCSTWSETSVAPSQLTQFWQIPRHRTLSYSLCTPFFVTTTP